MGRNARKEAIVKLRDEITACLDNPKMLVSLTRQLNKLLPKKKAPKGRPRNETPTRKTLAKDKVALETQSTYVKGSSRFLDDLPMGVREWWRVLLGLEAEELRRHSTKMTREEMDAYASKIVDGFSGAERAAYEAYNAAESKKHS